MSYEGGIIQSKLFSSPLIFNWDEGNIMKNWQKHAVTSEEAEQVFLNKPLLLLPDTEHSESEVRYLCLGKTNANRRLCIAFTMRDEHIRVISARSMNSKERKIY